MYLLLKLLPKKFISKCVGILGKLTFPRAFIQFVIKKYIYKYQVSTQEIELPIESYANLNSFFIRKLKKNVRKISHLKNAVTSPVDGSILNFGFIQKNSIIQAKGRQFYLNDLIPKSKYTSCFENGQWITIYLSPKDYHRIHFPIESQVIGYNYSRGRLFPVNSKGVEHVENLFSKNERLTTYLQTPYGLIALVKIGATCVGKIHVCYDSIQTHKMCQSSHEKLYSTYKTYQKGDELGYFELGSTVILCFEKKFKVKLESFKEKQTILLGEVIGSF